MNKLNLECSMWTKNGFKVEVVNAPKDACTFDKMIIVFAGKGVRRVSLYDSKEDKIIGQY